MITLNPAWQLGIDKRVGSLEVGKDADLAIFSAHPFAPDARVEMTLVDGACYFDRAQDLAARTPRPRREVARVKRAWRRRSSSLPAPRRGACAPPDGGRSPSAAARVVTVSGPVHRERGTVVIGGGKIAAVGADVPCRRARRSIDATGKTVYPGLIDGADHLGLTEIGSVRRLGRHHRGRRHQPARQGLGGGAPAQRADPGGARQRRHRGARGARGRPRLRPERPHPPRRHHARTPSP